MDLAELRRFEEIEAQLRAWDWQADLKADDRSYAWLARKTGTPPRTVYAYAYHENRPPTDWLRAAYRVIRGLDK